ncbi:tannase/feruloyl esterase family alpha/beta hydrolase [Rhodovulum sp. DZ06]|uniref:tannase/feruloyl esterase family alpha/beta hydrolase n=1 Tax=Rhodovulum sp. DZ06 TaxID=3425126 RepID=UPI003D343105
MKTETMSRAAALFAATALGALPAAAAECADLAALSLRGVDIAAAAAQPAGMLPPDPMSGMTGAAPRGVEAPAHCLVEGRINDRTGADGKRYGIRFQARLPDDWSGRFLFQGGGAMDGFIAPAVGMVPSTGATATPALVRGYAVVSMDGGHEGLDASFAFDQQARLDLAYNAIGEVTDVARALIAARYDAEPSESYFMGCSNGGREAMIAAQRYPTAFDGVVAGNPGFRLTRAALAENWDVAALMAVAPGGALHEALSQADLDAVAGEVIRQCDAADGLEDGIVARPCDFDPAGLSGKLAEDRLAALLKVMNGAMGADGPIYADWPWDPGLAAPGWRAWKLGTPERPALNLLIGQAATSQVFMTPPRAALPQPLDFDALAANVASVAGYVDADEPWMSSFTARGGKMVIFHGAADPVFSAHDIAAWTEEAQALAPDAVRLFMVPGMTHCGGGAAFEDFDPLTLLEEWRATGEAPEAMIARAPSMPGREMPICAHPSFAAYQGGDPDAADSFACVKP